MGSKFVGSEDELCSKLAKHEVGWWQAHHRKKTDKLVDEMAKLYELQFNISYKDAVSAVKLRAKATKTHDIAEDFEDKGNKEESEKYWEKTEELLKKHFEILLDMT